VGEATVPTYQYRCEDCGEDVRAYRHDLGARGSGAAMLAVWEQEGFRRAGTRLRRDIKEELKMHRTKPTCRILRVAYLVLVREPIKRRPRSLGGSLAPEPQ
jgi:hypothetical protein